MKLLRWIVCSCCVGLTACGPKAPIKPGGDFQAINPNPDLVGSFAKRPPSDRFELAFHGDLKDALLVIQRLQPQLLIRPVQGNPTPIPVEVDLRNVSLYEALTALKDQVAKDALLDFNPAQKKGRPYVQIRYLRNGGA